MVIIQSKRSPRPACLLTCEDEELLVASLKHSSGKPAVLPLPLIISSKRRAQADTPIQSYLCPPKKEDS